MAEANSDNKEKTDNTFTYFASGIAVIFLLVIGGVLIMAFRHDGAGSFASVASLILVGLAAFIGIMNLLSFSAHWMKITDDKQPFGLPEGTVRAILTIAFIVLVGVLTSFLLSNTNRPPFSDKSIIIATGVSASAAALLEQKFMPEGVITIMKDTTAENATSTVRFLPRIDYRQNDEIAKQILTILSTILAAMIGFYFGAKPGESGSTAKTDDRAALLADFTAAKAKPPTITTVSGKIGEIAKPEDRPAFQKRLEDISAKVKAADDALANPAATIETIRTSVTDAQAALGTLKDLDGEVLKAGKTALLADLNAAKAKDPTLAAVLQKIDAITDPTKQGPLKTKLNEISVAVEAAGDAFADPVATIETIRANVTDAKTALGQLEDLNKRVGEAGQ
jgi:membrane protein YdbS with pleckstrin-like domain